MRSDSTARVSSSFSPAIHEVDVNNITQEEAHDWAAYPFGAAWAIQELVRSLGGAIEATGFDCYIESHVPVGAGLSSSAAIECSVALALNELWAAGLDRNQMARVGQMGKNQIVGAPTGIMDQSARLLGETDHAVFLDCRSLEAKSIPLGFATEGLELLIIDTRVAHRLVDGGYASRRAACEAGAAAMGVTSLRDLTGGGFGGAAIALTPIANFSEVSLSVIDAFEALGYARPEVFAVSAAQGAKREL